jgi:hypothetical protein
VLTQSEDLIDTSKSIKSRFWKSRKSRISTFILIMQMKTYLFQHIYRGSDPFDGHYLAGKFVAHLLNDAIGTTTQVANLLQIVGVHMKCLLADGDCGGSVKVCWPALGEGTKSVKLKPFRKSSQLMPVLLTVPPAPAVPE